MSARKEDQILDMMHLTGCTREAAIGYLEAEEWVTYDALKSYRADHRV